MFKTQYLHCKFFLSWYWIDLPPEKLVSWNYLGKAIDKFWIWKFCLKLHMLERKLTKTKTENKIAFLKTTYQILSITILWYHMHIHKHTATLYEGCVYLWLWSAVCPVGGIPLCYAVFASCIFILKAIVHGVWFSNNWQTSSPARPATLL